MAAYPHWFISRQKRQLTTILDALTVFSDICVGYVWSGNTALQEAYEDKLSELDITRHGGLRARRVNQGGGGIRTLFTQLKDLGLVFTEDDSKKCRLTLIGEKLVSSDVKFVDGMRLQLQRYQYPSATRVESGNRQGRVSSAFKVHPFQFMFRLLKDARLENTLSMEEMYGIVIHRAVSDNDRTLEDVISAILEYRSNGTVSGFVNDDANKTYSNIANTFFNYIALTQYIDRGEKTISIRAGKEDAVDVFIQKLRFIPFPEVQENYQRNYGRGFEAKDHRRFDGNTDTETGTERLEKRVIAEYVRLKLKMPIVAVTHELVQKISETTAVDERFVERVLMKIHSANDIDDFFAYYREIASLGRLYAKEFELATCEVFKSVFGMNAKHIGNNPNQPDVFVQSDEYDYCGIIDNKAYQLGYSISGDHRRVMEMEYIPHYKEYGNTDKSLAFFSYIAGSFKKNIDSQIMNIVNDTGVNGSAMPVNIMINMMQDYVEKGRTHEFIKNVFSVNREVRLMDIE